MHKNSLDLMSSFVAGYLSDFQGETLQILDFGSQGVDADARTYRQIFSREDWHYTGLDIAEGVNVDICVSDPYVWSEIPGDSFDVVTSGQTLEHVPYFWNLAFEVGRVLRPGGLACLIAPSGGHEHRYPVDCWRFFPDGFTALAAWLGFEPLETYTDWSHYWGDSVLVMKKPVWDTNERRDFERRWKTVMTLLPHTPDITDVSFSAAAEVSILDASPTAGARVFEGNRRASIGTAFHRLQSAALTLLGPHVTRSAIDARNRVRSRKRRRTD